MRTPDEVIGKLTKDQLAQVAEIELTAEESLRTNDDVEFNVNDTRTTISEEVWKEVVRRAQKAGWNASITGAIVKIRRPAGH
jgi:hypothetical protein